MRHLHCDAPGWVALVACRGCGHTAPLPYRELVKRFGELFPAEQALGFVRCEKCGMSGPDARRVRLCEPGCPRQRG